MCLDLHHPAEEAVGSRDLAARRPFVRAATQPMGAPILNRGLAAMGSWRSRPHKPEERVGKHPQSDEADGVGGEDRG